MLEFEKWRSKGTLLQKHFIVISLRSCLKFGLYMSTIMAWWSHTLIVLLFGGSSPSILHASSFFQPKGKEKDIKKKREEPVKE